MNPQPVSGLFVLGVVFIVLKLANIVAWSWWLVLLPLYGPALIGCILLLPILIVAHRKFA